MLAIRGRCMAIYPAETVIKIMGAYNGYYSRDQQPDMQGVPDLFCQQKQDADAEDGKGQEPVMVFSESMAQSINAHQESQYNHTVFK